MKQFETEFALYVDGIYFGRVWLTVSDLSDLEPIGRAVSGWRRYQSHSNPKAIYREVSK